MLYRQRYRIETARLPNWDYRSAGHYFVTICAGNRRTQPFGYVRNGMMCVSDIGGMAHQYWMEIPRHFSNVTMDQWIVMPDHVHGIIVIRQDHHKRHGRDAINRVSTCDGDKKSVPIGGITHTNNPMLYSSSIPTIIRWYKGVTTYYIHKINPSFQWQPRYHDRIIRSEDELRNVRRYIINNPKKD